MSSMLVRAAALALVCAMSLPALAERKTITIQKLAPLSMGLVGYAGAEGARSDSAALQKYLSAKLNREITTRVFKDYDALATALAAGEVDLGWTQPFAMVAAQKKGAVTPIVKAVRHGLPFYRGVLFTRNDSGIDGIKSLKDRSVAWVDQTSGSGYLFPRASIVQAGFKPKALFKSETFAGDHEAVCRAVLEGKVQVGATFADDRPAGQQMQVDGCVQSLGSEAAGKLRIVATSAPIPNDAIAARPGLDQKEIARVGEVFLALAKDGEGKALLSQVFKAEGFEQVGADDFAPVSFALEAAGK